MSASKHKFSSQLLLLGLASACAASVFAGPAGPVVGVGSASYAPAALTLTSTAMRTQINWQSFSLDAHEVLRFVQPNVQSTVLNHIVGSQSLGILGSVSSNGRVFFMSNGVVSGAGVNLDMANAIDRSLRLPRMALALGSRQSDAQARPLATLAGGRIFVIGQDAQAVVESGGEWVLNPGMTVELANASSPSLRVVLNAPDSAAINLTRLVAGKGEAGIYAGLFRVPEAARQAVERDADLAPVAVMEDRVSDTPAVSRFLRYASMRLQVESGSELMPQELVATLEPQPVLVATESEADRNGAVLLASIPMLPVAEVVATLEPQPVPAAMEGEAERHGVVFLASVPMLPVTEVVATLEPQPIPVAMEGEAERNGSVLFAAVRILPAAEVVATLEPQPIVAAFGSEMERNGMPILARSAVVAATEVLATLEPQSVAVRHTAEPDDVPMLAAQAMPAAPSPERVQIAAADNDAGQVRRERRTGAAVIVVARAQQSGMPAPEEGSNVKELRVERRAPRYFTDYRGGLFFM